MTIARLPYNAGNYLPHARAGDGASLAVSLINDLTNKINAETAAGSGKLVTAPTSIAFSGVQTVDQSYMWAPGVTYSGTATPSGIGIISPFNIYVGSDTVDASTGIIHLSVFAAASTNRTGGRVGIQGFMAAVGAPAAEDDIVGVKGMVRAHVNQGGVVTNYDSHKGGIFGGNSVVFTSGAATFLKTYVSHEFNTSLGATASAADKYGISIVKSSTDATRGTYDDAAIVIDDQDTTSVSWTVGLQFGAYAHKWAFGTDSTLIGVKTRVAPSPATSTALYGIDMSALTITAGGAGIVMPLITPASAAATGKAGSICWDASYIYVCTATNTWERVAIASW
jgi:hypothetical protein